MRAFWCVAQGNWAIILSRQLDSDLYCSCCWCSDFSLCVAVGILKLL